ncbi:hypothetical protein ACLBWX_04465 [Methylobacterium sp. M6A4_1b]
MNFDLTFSPNLVMPDEGAIVTGLWKGRAVQFECRPFQFDALRSTYDDIDFECGWTQVRAFYWLGLPDCVAAGIAAATLTQICDGIVFDPQDSLFLDGEAATLMARENELLLPKIEASLQHGRQ